MPDPKKHIDDDYTYVRGHVRRKKSKKDDGDGNDGHDEGCSLLGCAVITLLICLVAWLLWH